MPTIRPKQPETTLAANHFTAYCPDYSIGSKISHIGKSAWYGLKRLVTSRKSNRFHGLRSPGDLSSASGSESDRTSAKGSLSHLKQATTPTMRSRETMRDLPQLPAAQIDDVERYLTCANTASRPHVTDTGKNRRLRKLERLAGPTEDAFFAQAANGKALLPSSVLNSSLVNASAGTFRDSLQKHGVPAPDAGVRDSRVMTQLSDTKTGFAAGITYHANKRELVIAFPGLGAAKMTGKQRLRSAMNWAGFLPKNLSQASKLTRHIKQHVAALNASLPPDQQIKLTVTGHSMGGGMAAYASLKNGVPGVVINPMRLGWAARASIGQGRMEEADKYLTEVVTQGDYLADNNASKLYLATSVGGLVFDSRGPLGSARRYMLPKYDHIKDPHRDVGATLQTMRDINDQTNIHLGNSLPLLQQTSPRAHGELMQGVVHKAVAEAVYTGTKHSPHPLTRSQSREVGRLVQKLMDNQARNSRLSFSDDDMIDEHYEEDEKTRDALGKLLGVDSTTDLQKQPKVVQALMFDFQL